MKLLNFGTRLGKHSYKDHNDKHVNGSDKLNVEAVPDQPWQKNGRQQPRGAFGWTDATNYDHLRQSPHGHGPYAAEIHKHNKEGNDFTSGWPIERTKVNGKYIHIDHDASAPQKFEAHAFDTHPIMEYYDKAQHKLSDQDHMNFIDKAVNWHNPENPIVNKWLDQQENKKTDSTGTTPSKPVHPELEEFPSHLDHSEHDPNKHKLRLSHALENPSLYHSPTTKKTRKQQKAMEQIGANISPQSPAEGVQLSSADQKVVEGLKGIHTLPEAVQHIALKNIPDHLIEAAGLRGLKEKLGV